jgi:MFS family permease
MAMGFGLLLSQWNLTQAVAFVLVGRLSDLFGRPWFFIIGNCIGLIGTSQFTPFVGFR